MSNPLFGLSADETDQLNQTYHQAITLLLEGNVMDAGLKLKALGETLQKLPQTEVVELRALWQKTMNGLKQKFMLSKTSYLKGCQCQKLLYLYKHSPSLRDPISELTQAKFHGGHSFEDVFRTQHYPNGKSVETILQGYIQFYPYLTELLLHQGVSTLFEPAFVHNKTLVMIDVLNKLDDGSWEIIEIKNSRFLKDVFIHDAALQYHVVSNKIERVGRVQIVLNQKGKAEYFDITAEVLCRQEAIKERIEEFGKLLIEDVVPEVEVGAHCFVPYKCDFFGYCHQVKSSY